MILDQPQTVMLSSAVQEISEDVVAPTPQAVRAPSLKTSIWQCLIKLGQGTVEFTGVGNPVRTLWRPKNCQRGANIQCWGCVSSPCEEELVWALVSPWAPDTLRLLSASLHSCGNGMFSCAGHSTAVLFWMQHNKYSGGFRHILPDTSLTLLYWSPGSGENYECPFKKNSIAVEKVMNKYKVEKRINFTESGQVLAAKAAVHD